jgi:hypothetical protein
MRAAPRDRDLTALSHASLLDSDSRPPDRTMPHYAEAPGALHRRNICTWSRSAEALDLFTSSITEPATSDL